MAVNTIEISATYNTLFTAVETVYNSLWDNNKIDAETYAQLVGQASAQLLSLSAELVQKQEQITKDLDIKERQMLLAEAESAKKLILMDEEKETADAQQLILAKDLLIKDYENLVLQVDAHNTNLKQIDSITESIKVSTTQKVKLDKETALLGMDDVIKINTIARDGTHVYTPSYTV